MMQNYLLVINNMIRFIIESIIFLIIIGAIIVIISRCDSEIKICFEDEQTKCMCSYGNGQMSCVKK